MNRPLLLPSFFLAATAIVVACSSNASSDAKANEGTDAGRDGPAAETGASPEFSICEETRKLAERCGEQPNCGASFAAWCAANDAAINSDAYRRAQAKCIPTIGCDANERDACEAKHFATETPTTAQTALAEAYCAMCQAGVSSCLAAVRSDATTDIYVAIWELKDSVVDEIRTTCTGASFDAGADCAKAFGGCAADIYLARLPDCP